MRVTQHEKDLIAFVESTLGKGFTINRSAMKRPPARASYDLMHNGYILASNLTVSEAAAAATAIANYVGETGEQPMEETISGVKPDSLAEEPALEEDLTEV